MEASLKFPIHFLKIYIIRKNPTYGKKNACTLSGLGLTVTIPRVHTPARTIDGHAASVDVGPACRCPLRAEQTQVEME